MGKEHLKRFPEQPFNSLEWATFIPEATRQYWLNSGQSQPFTEPLTSLSLARHPNFQPEKDLYTHQIINQQANKQLAAGTLIFTSNGLIRSFHHHTYFEGLQKNHLFPLIRTDFLYYPEENPLTHTDGPVIKVSSVFEFHVSSLPGALSSLPYRSIFFASSRIKHPGSSLVPAEHGELRTQVSLYHQQSHQTIIDSEFDTSQEMTVKLAAVRIEFIQLDETKREVTLTHLSSNNQIKVEFNVNPREFRPENMFDGRPPLPAKLSFK
ncbi:MAG TPA: hypothetical protein VD999_05905 [Vitreimonas sp.]|nr:hypothetical protein [Vitreimonas sp.]